jgi:hypothetical protein
MAHRLVSSNRWTRKASAASCNARMACDCHLIPSSRGLTVSAISRTCSASAISQGNIHHMALPAQCASPEHTNLAKGSFRIRSSVLLWYFLISLNATVPGRYLRFLPCGTGSPAVRAIIVSTSTRQSNATAVRDTNVEHRLLWVSSCLRQKRYLLRSLDLRLSCPCPCLSVWFFLVVAFSHCYSFASRPSERHLPDFVGQLDLVVSWQVESATSLIPGLAGKLRA